MQHTPRQLALVASMALLGGCTVTLGVPSRAASELTSRELLTEAQIGEGGYRNMYEAISALRATWLRQRGLQSLRREGQIWVYLDHNQLGGIETLRLIEPTTVLYARFYSAPDATTRWGLDHNHGAIYISTVSRFP